MPLTFKIRTRGPAAGVSWGGCTPILSAKVSGGSLGGGGLLSFHGAHLCSVHCLDEGQLLRVLGSFFF